MSRWHAHPGPTRSEESRAQHAAYQRGYRAAHLAEEKAYKVARREDSRAQAAIWRADNPDKVREGKRRYRLAHAAEEAARQAKRRALRREQILETNARYRAAHREEARKKTAAWKEANPDRVRSSRSKVKAVRKGASLCDHAGCLAVGATQLAWMTSEHVCWMCGTPVWQGVNLHMDHVLPIARGGVHCAENLRPACGPCNMQKGAKVLEP